jgi:hypothetical protein
MTVYKMLLAYYRRKVYYILACIEVVFNKFDFLLLLIIRLKINIYLGCKYMFLVSSYTKLQKCVQCAENTSEGGGPRTTDLVS